MGAGLGARRTPGGRCLHKFLYFPDENHWVLTPQHARLWYETVFAFLDEHVDLKPFRRPAGLRLARERRNRS